MIEPRQYGAQFLESFVAPVNAFGIGDDGVYRNTPATDLFLDKRKPSYVGGLLEMCNTRLYGYWGNLTEGLRTGKPQNEAKHGGHNFDRLYGDPGSDSLFGGSEGDRLYGGRGNDTLFGQAGTDGLWGGGGNDRLYGQEDPDRHIGGPGNDYIDAVSRDNDTPDTLLGGPGNDKLRANDGSAAVDVLDGGVGVDSCAFDASDTTAFC